MIQWLKKQVQSVIMPDNHPIVQKRRESCETCPHQYDIPLVSKAVGPQCLMCGCLVNAKTRTVRERCPLGYW